MLKGLFGKKSKTVDQVARMIDDGTPEGSISQKDALQVSTVLSCIDIIASAIAVPELFIMRDLGKGASEKAIDDPIFRILNRRPNQWQTSFAFRQMMTMHAALCEEAVAVPVRDVRDETKITEILPILPQWITRVRRGRYNLEYRIADEYGPIGTFQPDELLIIRNYNWDMMSGLSALKLARKSLRLAINTEENISSLQRNGGRPSGILSSTNELSDGAIDRLKAAWGRVTSGAGRGKTAVLDNGMTFTQTAMTSVDAQTIETWKHLIEEVCRHFGVYPIMVGHSDKAATYASAESFFAAHNRKTQWRWQRLWAEALDEFVLDGAGPLFAKFENRELQLANIKDQGEFIAKMLGTGGGRAVISRNEGREFLGLGPVDGGDEIVDPIASTQQPGKEDGKNDQED